MNYLDTKPWLFRKVESTSDSFELYMIAHIEDPHSNCVGQQVRAYKSTEGSEAHTHYKVLSYYTNEAEPIGVKIRDAEEMADFVEGGEYVLWCMTLDEIWAAIPEGDDFTYGALKFICTGLDLYDGSVRYRATERHPALYAPHDKLAIQLNMPDPVAYYPDRNGPVKIVDRGIGGYQEQKCIVTDRMTRLSWGPYYGIEGALHFMDSHVTHKRNDGIYK